ncbi:Scr1 family TA system antitoxin-like transcriptional regulator [Kitasatospora sp. NPDC094015]|uniref:helix-turn-helix domain-containing protein n=1 Tax=Kitasatospora sp. NPDC094015 TaxID=3155205 RepID=UPI00331CCA30
MVRRAATVPKGERYSPQFLAWLLTTARESAGLTITDLAARLHCDRSFVSRLESGGRVPQERLIEQCDEVLGTGDLLAKSWAKIDWHQEVEHPDWFRRYVELEAQAETVLQYQAVRISGLLQTPAYARAVLTLGDAAGDEEQISERVDARMSRQTRFLAEDGPMLVVVLDESVIRRLVGGRKVMYEQLQHLLALARRPNIVIQVAPYELGERAPDDSALTLLTLPGGSRWIYSESLDKGHFVSEPTRVSKYSKSYDRLRADALSAQDSVRLIRRVMEGLLNMGPKIDYSAASWFKSSLSGSNGGECIEVAYNLGSVVPVRDSKDPGGPALVFPSAAWAAFVRATVAGEFGAV